ncbi:MAG: hypothetical protein IJV04_01835 [Lachnospiraceae bacterium]|nr:hypothetical protein [Lachnospiraceae bacterium]
MSGKEFESALRNFSFEAAAGRGIRHLCDLGFSAEEIRDRLDFPVGAERIREEMEAYAEEKKRIAAGEEDNYAIVKEYGAYGRVTFRKVPLGGESDGA